MCDLIFSAQEFFKIVPGLAIFPLSFYLAWKKLGISVSASYSVSHERTTATRIGTIFLYNHKDRPVPIHSIQAVINKEITYEIDKYNPPLILKPLESISIETNEYSSLYLADGPYEQNFVLGDTVEIYIETASKVILCKEWENPQLVDFSGISSTYRKAAKTTSRFNELVYNENSAYAITYRIGSDIETAIIDTAGFIGRGWNFRFNMVPPESMKSEDTVHRFLESIQFDKVTEWFSVDDLRKP